METNRTSDAGQVRPEAKTAPPAGAPGGGIWTVGTVLIRHRRTILSVMLGFAFVAGLLSLLTPRHYTARASFVPQEPMMSQGLFSQLAAQVGLGAISGGGETSPQFYADLLRSTEILRDVVTHEFASSATGDSAGTLLGYFRIGADESFGTMKAVEKLRDVLGVDVDRVSGVVRLEVHTKSPELSAAILERMIELVSDYNLQRRQSQARAEREFVERRLAEARAELDAAEEGLAAFYRANRRFEESSELVAQEARIEREVSIREELFRTLSQSFESARIEEVRSTPVITVIDRPAETVQPRRRGTIRKTILALLAGAFFGLGLAFGREYVEIARQTRPGDYNRFAAAWREFTDRFRRGRSRTPPAATPQEPSAARHPVGAP